MVTKYVLWMNARLENFTNLQPMGGVDSSTFRYLFKVKCLCGLVSQNEVCLSLEQTSFLSNKEPSVHLVRRCRECDYIGSIKMQSGNGYSLTENDSLRQRAAPLMTFVCDGVEPVGVAVSGLWEGATSNGTRFKEIDLNSGTFEYPPEDGEAGVRISNVQFEFRVAR